MARYTGPVTRKSRRLRVDLVGGDDPDQLGRGRPAPAPDAGADRPRDVADRARAGPGAGVPARPPTHLAAHSPRPSGCRSASR